MVSVTCFLSGRAKDLSASPRILGRRIHIIQKTTEVLIVTRQEISLEMNADKINYMIISRDLNAGLSHSMKTDNSSFKRVEEFRYLGTTLTNYGETE